MHLGLPEAEPQSWHRETDQSCSASAASMVSGKSAAQLTSMILNKTNGGRRPMLMALKLGVWPDLPCSKLLVGSILFIYLERHIQVTSVMPVRECSLMMSGLTILNVRNGTNFC